MARGLARAGAAVAVAARKREKSLRAVDELEALGAEPLDQVHDLTAGVPHHVADAGGVEPLAHRPSDVHNRLSTIYQ